MTVVDLVLSMTPAARQAKCSEFLAWTTPREIV